MAVKVLIPTPLRQFTGKQASIECSAATVGEALGNLTSTFGELRKHLYTDEGRIRSFVNVYLNDEDIRFLEKENTRTKDGDTISIVPSIAGGASLRRAPSRPRARLGPELGLKLKA
jgi:molybdopterin converting factor small subunit